MLPILQNSAQLCCLWTLTIFGFSFGFLPLDGSEGASVARKGSGQEPIMNNKRGGTTEVSEFV